MGKNVDNVAFKASPCRDTFLFALQWVPAGKLLLQVNPQRIYLRLHNRERNKGKGVYRRGRESERVRNRGP